MSALANAKPKRTRRLTNMPPKRRRLASGDGLQASTSLANEGRRIRGREARGPSERGAEEARGLSEWETKEAQGSGERGVGRGRNPIAW